VRDDQRGDDSRAPGHGDRRDTGHREEERGVEEWHDEMAMIRVVVAGEPRHVHVPQRRGGDRAHREPADADQPGATLGRPRDRHRGHRRCDHGQQRCVGVDARQCGGPQAGTSHQELRPPVGLDRSPEQGEPTEEQQDGERLAVAVAAEREHRHRQAQRSRGDQGEPATGDAARQPEDGEQRQAPDQRVDP
jgi:hypothetical protein